MRRAAAIAASLLLVARAALAEPPCPGCALELPTHGDGDAPRPLLVALHGDGGDVGKLTRAWKKACDDAGVILLAPRCPRELGCPAGSYWQWLQTGGHDPAWLGGLIDAVAEKHAVDPARVYATGYSGGATYLGWYVPRNAARFAAVFHLAGGAPYGGPCPACKVPLLFTIGALDPMIAPYTAPLRAYYDACGGHELVWQTLPGVTHEGILGVLQAGRAKDALAWLLARKASCPAERADAGTLGGDASSDADAPGRDAGVASASPVADVASGITPADASPWAVSSPPRAPTAGGCACDRGGGVASGLAGAPLLLGLLVARRRRRDAA